MLVDVRVWQPDISVNPVIIAMAHTQYMALKSEKIPGLMKKSPVLVKVRGMMDPGIAGRNGLYCRKQ